MLVVLSFFIIKSFILSLVSGFILAYLSSNAFKKLRKRFGKPLSALICLLLVIIIILIPISILFVSIVREVQYSLNQNTLNIIFENVSHSRIVEFLGLNFEVIKDKLISSILLFATNAITTYLPKFFIYSLVSLFSMYYLLIEWDYIIPKIKGLIPLRNKDKLFLELSNITKGIVYGFLIISVIEFFVSALGFYLSGLSYFLLAALLIAFLAFIPSVGPTLVWLPLAAFYLFTGRYYSAVGIIITGIILSIVIDTILRSKIIGDKIKINPIIMLVGMLGGIIVFGIFGFLIGPIILLYTLRILNEIGISLNKIN